MLLAIRTEWATPSVEQIRLRSMGFIANPFKYGRMIAAVAVPVTGVKSHSTELIRVVMKALRSLMLHTHTFYERCSWLSRLCRLMLSSWAGPITPAYIWALSIIGMLSSP